MMKGSIIVTIIFMLFILTGCLPTYVVDDLRLVQALGYDAVSGKKIRGTVAVPNYASGGGQSQGGQSQNVPSSVDSFSGISFTGKTEPTKLETKSQEPLRLGKLEVLLFDKKLAARGLREFIDYFSRDPEIGREMYLAVSEGSTYDILKGKYANGTAVSRYLNDMLKQNSNRNLPKTNLHGFLYNYYSEGMDPFLPVIKKIGNHLKVSGIAIFQNDKLKDEIPFDDAIIFKMLNQPFNQGIYEIQIKRDEYVTVENISSKVSYKIKNGASRHPEININILVNGVIRETPFKNAPKNYFAKLNKTMARALNLEAARLIERFQKEKVDPLGFGDKIRSQTRQWDSKNWEREYPHTVIHPHIQVSIDETGITT